MFKLIVDIVKSSKFQNFILLIIIINSIIMGLETSNALMCHIGVLLNIANHICLGIFILEIALKLIVYKKSFWHNRWDVFDFFIIVISIISVLPAISSFRIFRLLRIVRNLKLVISTKPFQVIVTAIWKSLPGISWTTGFLFIIFYIYALLGTSLFGLKFDAWFGSLGKSLYTLFQVMTMESWSMGISRPVMQEYPFAWLYFISFILVSSFFIMNIIVGIVVNAVSEVSSLSQENEKLENRNDETSINIINTTSNSDTDSTTAKDELMVTIPTPARAEDISQERIEGIAAGKIEILIELMKAGDISVKTAAAKVSMSEAEFEALCAKNQYIFPSSSPARPPYRR